MKLATALRVAIEAIEYRLKKEWTFEANMHDLLGLTEFSVEAKNRKKYIEAKEVLSNFLEDGNG